MVESNKQPGGNGHREALHFVHPPKRVVSLVPSMTESMFDLGFGDSLVGITDFCTNPKGAVEAISHVGGPKNPRIQEILALKPDLVLADWEENTPASVAELDAAGVAVWVTYPSTVRELMDILWTLSRLFKSQMAQVKLQTLELTLDWAISALVERQRVRYFCPIWYEQTTSAQPWWMTFNRYTYCNDLLELCGLENVFAERKRRYPLEADLGLAPAQSLDGVDTRYPRVGLDELRGEAIELILLPDEPYRFDEAHRTLVLDLLGDTPAVHNGRVLLVDGSLITWHGTRLALALRELPALFDLHL
jgi:ABC-type Fe3+-hydroxamate transport system substrate-binding protein